MLEAFDCECKVPCGEGSITDCLPFVLDIGLASDLQSNLQLAKTKSKLKAVLGVCGDLESLVLVALAFEEASVEAAQRQARVFATGANGGVGRGPARAWRQRRAPFPLSPSGPPAVAIFWKNLLAAGQIFSAVEVRNGKPAPDLFLHAAERMGVSPAACAVVEDSQYGVQAARAAGMQAFGYTGSVTPAQMLEGPGTTVFDDMRELPRLLQSR